MKSSLLFSFALAAAATTQAASVLSFWSFEDNYDDASNRIDFAPNAGIKTAANLQAYLGDAAELDDNGGSGFAAFTSTTSNVTYGESRTIKFDDLKGGGDDFSIGGDSTFTVDKNDGSGPVAGEDFGNDALIYITLDTLGYEDLSLRFDVEGTPGDLPTSYDIYYRVGGSGTWFRDAAQNNIGITFQPYSPVDPDNEFHIGSPQSLNAALNNQAVVEIIINDFAEAGNNEMELDNFEIVGTAVPEPSSGLLALLAGVATFVRRRR